MLAEAIVHFGHVSHIPHWFAKNNQLVKTTQDEDSEENSDENEEGSDDEVQETERPYNPNAKSRQLDRLRMLSCWATRIIASEWSDRVQNEQKKDITSAHQAATWITAMKTNGMHSHVKMHWM